jgi:5-(carboxyamino)imidazole ribonucleotide mutase
MPGGVPVATVAINNAKNAGLLAAQMLGIKFPEIRNKIKQYKMDLETKVLEKAKHLEDVGYRAFEFNQLNPTTDKI